MNSPTMDNAKCFKKLAIQHPMFKDAVRLLQETYRNGATFAEGQCICGPSGVGKSTVAEYFKSQVEAAVNPESNHVPVVFIRLKSAYTTKNVVDLILNELGIEDIDSYTLGQREKLLFQQLKVCRVGIILIDEFQHLLRKDRYVNTNVCNFIKVLMDSSEIPVVLFGIEEGCRLFEIDYQLYTRFSRPLVIQELAPANGNSVNYFNKFFDALMDQFPVKRSSSLVGKDVAFRFQIATGGNLRVLKRLLLRVLSDCQRKNKATVGLDEFEDAYKAMVNLDVLRNKNNQVINPFKSSIEVLERYRSNRYGCS